MRLLRIVIGAVLVLFGLIFFILPGTLLLLMAGLLLLSMEWPLARGVLTRCQHNLDSGARRLDRYLLARRLRR